MNKNAKELIDKLAIKQFDELISTDPDFVEIFGNFAYDEVYNQSALDSKTRGLAILAALLGIQATDEFSLFLSQALHMGVLATEAKEVVYQAVAYLGIGRVYPFFKGMNQVFLEEGIELPLKSLATTTEASRLYDGEQTQIAIFGEGMKDFKNQAPNEKKHINHWLVDNCFGDYYTRKGLDYNQREMITFCFLAAQGGCEPQLISHAKANLRLGNNKAFLIDVVSQCLPYIGYPRSLNALRAIDEASK